MSISFIGSTIGASTTLPTSLVQSDLEAVSHTEIGLVVSVGELGDTSEDVTIDLLKTGRRKHVNGIKDLGEISITCEYDRSDAGYVILKAANNTNTTISFVVTDSDGDSYYFQGLVANMKDMERTASQYKGFTFIIRGQTGITKIDGS